MGGKGSEQVEVEAPKGFGASLMHNLMTPGSSLTSTMQMIVNVIYAVLFFVICLCIYGDSSYIHFYGMMVLLIGLICTTNWFFMLVLAENPEGESEATEEGKKDQ